MSLKSIQPDTADNLEGLQAIYFIPAPFVTDIPEAADNVISDDISLAGGKKWLSLYVTLNSADYNEEKQRNEHGVFYEKELTGFLPKDSPGIAAQLEEMENYRFHVIYKDRNDHYKLVQDLEFTHELSTDGRNGFEITFEGSGVKPGYFYTGLFETEEATIDADQAVSSSLIFVLDASSDDTVEQNYEGVSGEYYASKATLTNVQSFTIYVNNTSKSGKFLVGTNDTLKLEVTRQDITQDAIVNIPHT